MQQHFHNCSTVCTRTAFQQQEKQKQRLWWDFNRGSEIEMPPTARLPSGFLSVRTANLLYCVSGRRVEVDVFNDIGAPTRARRLVPWDTGIVPECWKLTILEMEAPQAPATSLRTFKHGPY